MDQGLSQGMFLAGLLLSLPPILLGIGIGVLVVYRYRLPDTTAEHREAPREERLSGRQT